MKKIISKSFDWDFIPSIDYVGGRHQFEIKYGTLNYSIIID